MEEYREKEALARKLRVIESIVMLQGIHVFFPPLPGVVAITA